MYHTMLAVYSKVIRSKVRMFRTPNNVRVLAYHDVNQGESDRFRMQIECIQRKWDFMSPEVFRVGLTSSKTLSGRQVLLTFDDGFESNYRVAQEILNPLGIKAIFFVVPDFVNTVGVENQRQFVETRLYPGEAARSIPSGLRSMTWDQIRELSNQGHVIGCHTRTHARLSELHEEKLLVEEIVASGDEIEQRLGVKVEDFAFTFGTLASFSPQALSVAATRYKYIYSGLRGSNTLGVSPLAIRRETVHPWDSKGFALGVLDGVADFQYRSSVKVLDGWVAHLQGVNGAHP